MNKENIMDKTVKKFVKNNLMKGLAIGFSAAIVLGAIVGIIIVFNNPGTGPTGSDGNGDFVISLAEQVQGLVPEVVSGSVLGNGTSAIYPTLMHADMTRLGDETDYSWEVTAHLFDITTEESDEKTFTLSKEEVDTVALGLFNTINNTEKIGMMGEAPYDWETLGDLANIFWGLRLQLANSTTMELIILMDGLIIFNTYQDNAQDGWGAVLSPPEAFETLRLTLQDLFKPYLEG